MSQSFTLRSSVWAAELASELGLPPDRIRQALGIIARRHGWRPPVPADDPEPRPTRSEQARVHRDRLGGERRAQRRAS